jgi:hypothetical protein
MIIWIKLFLNSKLDLIGTVKFVKQLFLIQIQKGRKVLLWNQVKSRMKACYSELVFADLGAPLEEFCMHITLQIYTVKLKWKRDTCKKCTLYKYLPYTVQCRSYSKKTVN